MSRVFSARFSAGVAWISAVVVLATGRCSSSNAKASPGEPPPRSADSTIPDTWDEARLASLQVPLVHPGPSPEGVPGAYYHSIPVRPIYRSYDVYRPDREPAGYLEWLQSREPEIVWDDTRSPVLESEADWIRAGELVFDSPLGWGNGSIGGPYQGLQVRDSRLVRVHEGPSRGGR